MRPIHIIVSAFGPYAGKTEIPMHRLGEKGLYLITGETGAGKTTIFDAITYALYGEASGPNREPSMLRSKYALPEAETYVEMEFLHAGERYRIRRNPEQERPAKRGTGMVAVGADALLEYPDGRVVTKAREVTRAVRELLGVDRSQFSQISMIAQGDFMKLLLANTKERQAVFREIFKTGYYQDLQERLKSEAGKLEKLCEKERDSVKQYINGILCDEEDALSLEVAKAKEGKISFQETEELLERLLYEDRERYHKLQQTIEALDKQLEEVSAALSTAETFQKCKAELAQAQEEYSQKKEELKRVVTCLEEEKSHQDKRDCLEKELAILAAELLQYEKLEEDKQAFAQATRALTLGREVLENKQEVWKQLEEELERTQKELLCLENAGEQKEKLLRAKEREDVYERELSQVQEQLESYLQTMQNYVKVQTAYRQFMERAQALQEAYLNKNRAFLDQQAGILAETLEEGMPCPVCGSVSHPAPCRKNVKAPSKEAVEAAREDAERAKQLAEEESARAHSVSGQLKTQKEALQRKARALFADALDETTLMLEGKEQLAGVAKYVEKQMSETRQTIESLREGIDREEARILRKLQLQKRLTEREEAVVKLEQECEKQKLQITALETQREAADNQIREKQAALRFESKLQAEQYRAQLLTQKETWKKQLEQLEKTHTACQNQVGQLEGICNQLRAQVEGYKETDVEACIVRKKQILESRQENDRKQKKIYAYLNGNKSALQHIAEKSANITRLEEKWMWLRTLSNTANGNISGKEKVMLETYIQMQYFDRILERANTRFMKMTSGQYELKRQTQAGNNRSQSGLELDVVDHYNGTVRSVKTLSGGESFKAALAMALGLSDEVQSSAGGIRLDTMFVDEGFGSLDDDSLQQAIDTLAGLTEGNRLVGIISHVGELKRRVDKQVVVSKVVTGSSVTIEV